jgi:hypothetical protein
MGQHHLCQGLHNLFGLINRGVPFFALCSNGLPDADGKVYFPNRPSTSDGYASIPWSVSMKT